MTWLARPCCLGAAVCVFVVAWLGASTARAAGQAAAWLDAMHGQLPMAFEAIEGQAAAEWLFRSRGRGYSVHLTALEAVLVFSKPEGVADLLRITMIGAKPGVRVEGLGRLSGKTNYLVGNEPTKWRTDDPSFTRVRYADVYPGIDLVFYGKQRELEYDFVVAAGADPSRIRIRFGGGRPVRVDRNGDLVIALRGGEIRQRKPAIYQEQGGRRTAIAGTYVLRSDGDVRLAIGNYDRCRPLAIDPVLVYSSYLGGSELDFGWDVALDAAGNIYVTGETQSPGFPIRNAAQPVFAGGPFQSDVFITKLDPTGSTP